MKKIIINIGRQFGCGAKDVADAIGRRTGIPVYDSELLKKAAQDFGFSETLFSGSDEKKRCFSLSSIFNSNIFGCSSMNDDASLFAMQAEAIKNIAKNGSAIIIGRAANYILRDCDCCLDVFLTCPLEERAKRVSQREGMTVEEALHFFENVPSIRRKMETLYDVGLSYIRLGQPSTTLSGGEAQRIKLATELSRRSTGKTVYILDEPTTGLHFADVHKLTEILKRLTEDGNTVIVIEHNLDVIKTADYIIDIGPEGGDKGGTIVAHGTPEEIAANPNSYTGKYIDMMLKK